MSSNSNGSSRPVSSSTNPLLGQRHGPTPSYNHTRSSAPPSKMGVGLGSISPALGGALKAHHFSDSAELTASNLKKFANVTMRSRDEDSLLAGMMPSLTYPADQAVKEEINRSKNRVPSSTERRNDGVEVGRRQRSNHVEEILLQEGRPTMRSRDEDSLADKVSKEEINRSQNRISSNHNRNGGMEHRPRSRQMEEVLPQAMRNRDEDSLTGTGRMPSFTFAADKALKEEIHRSQNRVPSLHNKERRNEGVERRQGSNHMEEVLLQERQRQSGKVIAFPQDHGKNLLSQNAMIQSTSSIYSRNNLQLGASEASVGQQRLGVTILTGSRQLEKDLIKDLIFVFQGIDGSMIKGDAEGNFQFATKKPIHPGLRHQTLRLAELGFFYKQIKTYCDKPIVGLMAQGLKHALEKEVQEYYRLLAIVQSQVQQTMVDTPMCEQPTGTGEEMTMLKLTVWMYDCRPRFDALAGIVSSCENFKGGKMCSVLYEYSLHGDPMIRSVTNSLLSTTAKPMYLMLCQWILYGELEDPYGEFFIASDSTCKKERLWHAKYHIRANMLPSFISLKQAERILATGKNINFLKEICQHTQGYEGRGQIKSWLEKSPVACMFTEDDKVLNTAIEKAYKTTSKMVLDVLIQESKLIDHLKAIKRYLLLGQGDFIQHLLELIQVELCKPANKLYAHNIAASLESAIRATNTQFETEDILSRLDVRILPSSDKDLGWDVFCLDYKVHGSIGTVLTEDVMIRYNQLFNALWRIKRIEMILNTLWKDQTALFKFQRTIPELGPVLHRSQLLISEMIHFVHQTQYYIMFEATECAWDKLMEEVHKAVDLDEVIQAHKKFMETITSRSLLDRENRELLNQLRGIFDSVHELKSFLENFESKVNEELKRRKSLLPGSEKEKDAQKYFFSNCIRSAKGKIETLYNTTQDLVRSFLLVLNRQPDLTLQCLSFRLDFNEYYHFKDARLSLPLTYQHRRRSSNTFDPLNMSLSMSSSGIMNQCNIFTSPSIPESHFED